MINSEVAKSTYLIQAGVTTYPIGFEYHFNPDNTPQVAVKINDTLAGLNVDFVLSTDKSSIVLIPTPEEEEALTGPLDFSWMDRLVGKHLFVYRDIEFLQNSDYQVGRIDPEQIEKDFDESVMRDQILRQGYVDLAVKVTEACGDAEHAIEIANNASGVAAEALEVAESANEKSEDALTNSEDAVSTAVSAKDDARNALTKAGEANAKSDQAMGIADGAMEVAAEAMDVATEAKDAVESKQDRLTPGANVTIVDNVISSTGAVHSVNGKTGAVNLTIADLGAASADEVTTIKNDQDELGDQVSIIEGKIPGTASTTNLLATKSEVTEVENRVTTLRSDMNSGLSEIQTQVTAQATAIAGKIDQQQDAGNAGKALIIGEDGVVVPGAVQTEVDLSGYEKNSAELDTSILFSKETTTATYNYATGLGIQAAPTNNGSTAIGYNSTARGYLSTAVGVDSKALGQAATAIGDGAQVTNSGTAVGAFSNVNQTGTAIGSGAQVVNSGTAIGENSYVYSTSVVLNGGKKASSNTSSALININWMEDVSISGEEYLETLVFSNIYGIYKVIDASGRIPSARLASGGTEGQVLAKTDDGMAWQDAASGGGGDTIQFEQLPTPSADYAGKILQYVGEDGTYKSGHFYKCAETADIFSGGYTMDGTSITVTVDTQKFLAQNPVWMDQGVLVWRADGGDGIWSVWTQDPPLSLTDDELRNTWGVAVNTSDGSPYTGSNASITVQNMGTTYAWIEVEFGGGGGSGGEGQDLSNYLQLSGGTMTGPITLEWSGAGTTTNFVSIKSKYKNTSSGATYAYDLLKFTPSGSAVFYGDITSGSLNPNSSGATLGGNSSKWFRVHTQSLWNGGVLKLPTTAGTIARVEDIDAAVGDISTALTAIIGE